MPGETPIFENSALPKVTNSVSICSNACAGLFTAGLIIVSSTKLSRSQLQLHIQKISLQGGTDRADGRRKRYWGGEPLAADGRLSPPLLQSTLNKNHALNSLYHFYSCT